MRRRFVDTNVFLRFLTKDDPATFERCRDLFRKGIEGEVILVTSGMVIAELIWTLLSYYKVPKAEVVEKMAVIIGTKGIDIPDRDIIAESLILFGRKNVDYIDAYNTMFMKRHRLEEIYSYDRDFEEIESVKRLEP
jgi:predicted nucleic acid-binding protein